MQYQCFSVKLYARLMQSHGLACLSTVEVISPLNTIHIHRERYIYMQKQETENVQPPCEVNYCVPLSLSRKVEHNS